MALSSLTCQKPCPFPGGFHMRYDTCQSQCRPGAEGTAGPRTKLMCRQASGARSLTMAALPRCMSAQRAAGVSEPLSWPSHVSTTATLPYRPTAPFTNRPPFSPAQRHPPSHAAAHPLQPTPTHNHPPEPFEFQEAALPCLQERAPRESRTPDLEANSLTLWPTELWKRCCRCSGKPAPLPTQRHVPTAGTEKPLR